MVNRASPLIRKQFQIQRAKVSMKFRHRLTCAAIGLMLCPLCLSAQSASTSESAAQNKIAPPSAAVDDGSCTPAADRTPAPADDTAAHGFDLTSLDRAVRPCDDFFHFADGGWIKKNPIPAEYPSWGTFAQLRDSNNDKLHGILEAVAKHKSAKRGSVEQKIGDFYASCMNEAAIEKAGGTPLTDEFARIAKITTAADLQAEIARLQTHGVGALFGFGSEQDFKDSTRQIAIAAQGGLGLPDRDYYLKTDEKSQKLREAYAQHIQNMFVLLGDDAATAAAEAKSILDFETRLANASMPRADLRDPDKLYHKLDLAALKALTPHFSWNEYFSDIGYPSIDAVDVHQPEFFKAADTELANTPISDWKVYLRWHLIHESAPSLSTKFVDDNFRFYSTTLQGIEKIQPRWKRCTSLTDSYLGEALGQAYVKQYFPPEAKAAALEMVHNLIAALRADLQTLDWMSEETRKQAVVKLDAIGLKIGYPDQWRDYSAFHVDRGIYIENVRRGENFAFNYDLKKIGRPVDQTEWGMTPPTVNAYYSPTRNEIVFPAGILQPPFYDPHRDDAMNYGGMGAVIGHEMTHGFDDQGSRFDAQGNLRNWWTPDDLKNFKARGDCVAKQFDAFEVEEGLHENGKLVEGESIADLGGLTISFAALQKVLSAKPAPGLIDGFTPEQRFFLAWAQIWAGSSRPEYARLVATTNPHPLPQFRVNGPLSNMPEFAKAYRCANGDAMLRPPAERCRIW
jgi:putative endopeptidase